MSSIHFTTISKFASRSMHAAKTLPALAAGLGLLLSFPGQARADKGVRSSGHVEVTVGIPNGEVSVGKTWESGGNREATEREPSRHDVTIIEHRAEPVRCERGVVIERRYDDERDCPRREAVAYCPRQEQVVYEPARTINVDPPRHIARDYRRCEPARVVIDHRHEGRDDYRGHSMQRDRGEHRRHGYRG